MPDGEADQLASRNTLHHACGEGEPTSGIFLPGPQNNLAELGARLQFSDMQPT